MSSVFERGEKWYVQFRDGTGRTVQRSTPVDIKTEAKRFAQEWERTAWRQRSGFEALSIDSGIAVGAMCDWWGKNRCPEASRYTATMALRRHVIDMPMGKVPVRLLTTAMIDHRLREMDRANISAATVNGLRRLLVTVFNRARKARLCSSNPASEAERRKEPRRVYETLKAEEVPILLPHVPDDWCNLFATGVFTGMRKGELIGLRRRDVDLEARTIAVRHSYERDVTKGGHQHSIPIADSVHFYLADALARSTSEFVFPGTDGAMRSKEADPQKVLRRALARAGIVEGYEHVCRRCKAGKVPHTPGGIRMLPSDGASAAACVCGLERCLAPCASTIYATRPRPCSCALESICIAFSGCCGTRTHR